MNIHILHRDWEQSAKELLCSAAKEFPKRKTRNHELLILSCYIDLNTAEEFINDLRSIIRLRKVKLAFDFSEVYKHGPRNTEDTLRSIQNQLGDSIQFSWKALASSHLMHGKAYSLVQTTRGKLSNGALLVTSANFTQPGFEGKNVEVGYLSTKNQDVHNFKQYYRTLCKDFGREVTSTILKEQQYLMEYALLASGQFIHKWSGNLRQLVGIRYELTPRAKEMGTIPPELEAIGFDTGNTVTRQVLELDDLPEKEIPRSFISRFTIETYWGRWCPTDAWNAIQPSLGNADKFIREFRKATRKRKLEALLVEAHRLQDDLVNGGLIKQVNEDYLENWRARISELRSDSHRLRRLYSGYDAHDLPYHIEQKKEVRGLFRNLEEQIGLAKKRNIARRKFLLAKEHGDSGRIRLTTEERGVIEEIGRTRK